MKDHQDELPNDQSELMRNLEGTKLSSLGFRIFPKRQPVIHPLSKNEKNRNKNKRSKMSRKKNR